MNALMKCFGALCLFVFYYLITCWTRFNDMADSKLTLEDEVESLMRQKDDMLRRISNLEREEHRMKLKVEKLNYQARELLPLTKNRLKLPIIFFITPTARRLEQKADLVRLSQTLAHISNLYWVVVEDASEPSPFIHDILAGSRLNTVHLTAMTPAQHKLNESDPNWKSPRGVVQRNTALSWLRANFVGLSRGVVYFGDDDNTYEWRLFNEIRSVRRVGIWPVGLVGGLLAESPLLHDNLSISGFNAVWKPERSFPMDMASFAVNISLVLKHRDAFFTYDSPRGYQESDFLSSLNVSVVDLEPKANFLSKVYVWHTRTEKAKLTAAQRKKFWQTPESLTEVEADAVQ